MDIYIVQSTWNGAIVGASARLQGAELIKADSERHNPNGGRYHIVNAELQDTE